MTPAGRRTQRLVNRDRPNSVELEPRSASRRELQRCRSGADAGLRGSPHPLGRPGDARRPLAGGQGVRDLRRLPPDHAVSPSRRAAQPVRCMVLAAVNRPATWRPARRAVVTDGPSAASAPRVGRSPRRSPARELRPGASSETGSYTARTVEGAGSGTSPRGDIPLWMFATVLGTAYFAFISACIWVTKRRWQRSHTRRRRRRPHLRRAWGRPHPRGP